MAGENVIPLQVRKLGEQIVHRIATRKILEKGFHGVTQTAHAGLPVANLWVNCNP